MSTSAGIGMKLENGSVLAIRVNWDGYPGYGMRPASPMVRRKRDFFEWEFTKKMNAVGL